VARSSHSPETVHVVGSICIVYIANVYLTSKKTKQQAGTHGDCESSRVKLKLGMEQGGLAYIFFFSNTQESYV
jgi:hypothetical protein